MRMSTFAVQTKSVQKESTPQTAENKVYYRVGNHTMTGL